MAGCNGIADTRNMRQRRNGEVDMIALQVKRYQYANHWPIWCVVDNSGAVLLCRETEAEAGEMLAAMDKAKGNQHINSAKCNDVTKQNPTLSEIGITKRQSSDWQKDGGAK